MLHKMQLLGSRKSAAAGTGLALFKQRETLSAAGAIAQQQTSQAPVEAAVALLCFSLPGTDANIKSETVAIRIRPGAPHSLCLRPGGPWESENAAVAINSGEDIDSFNVQALDIWGNPTAPTSGLPFSVMVSSPAISPAEQAFDVDASGVATVNGFLAVRSGEAEMNIAIKTSADNESMQAAAEVALPTQDLRQVSYLVLLLAKYESRI